LAISAWLIRKSIQEESAERLTDLDNTLAGTDVTSMGCNVSVHSIKPFVAVRSKSLRGQLDGKSTCQAIR
jgi:hypothetical protein